MSEPLDLKSRMESILKNAHPSRELTTIVTVLTSLFALFHTGQVIKSIGERNEPGFNTDRVALGPLGVSFSVKGFVMLKDRFMHSL